MASVKLTKSQRETMDWAKTQIDYARSHSFREYVAWVNDFDTTNERDCKWLDNAIAKDNDETYILYHWHFNHYNDLKNGMVWDIANSNTIRALERMGLIEIIIDGKENNDKYLVLNY